MGRLLYWQQLNRPYNISADDGRLRRAEEKARLAEEEVANALGIEFGDPVLFVERLMFALGERPIEVVRSHRADVYRYQIRLVRTSRARLEWPSRSRFAPRRRRARRQLARSAQAR